MDKKTKLYLGIGVVAVGAYLLFKSKKATPALTAAAPTPPPAKFVGMINELNSPTQKFNADGGKFASVGYNMRPAEGSKFASVGYNMRPMSGGMINTTDVVGARAGSQGSGIFANQDGKPFASVGNNMRPMSGGMINTTDVVGARAGSQNSGIFANQPFTGDVANMVGASGEKCFVNQSGKFFNPRTARYGQNQGVFAPKMPKTPMPRKITLPVEPDMPVEVTQSAPINNLVGQDGSRFFKVTDGAFVR
jgi:hypothetical protein